MDQRKILIVEDEDNIAMALELFIGRRGYTVSRAVDGDAALEALAADRPDLVVLDITLPKRSGFEVCQTMRNDSAYDDVKILMMTARGGKVERDKGMVLGADAFMTKPFSSADLLAQIDKLLEDPGG